MKQTMNNKTAIITGGSKGIGKATAAEIVKQGGNAILIARNKADLQQAAHELDSLTTHDKQFIETCSLDISDSKKVTAAINRIIKKHGVPDYLINCAGYSYPQYIEKLTFDDFKKNMETNYFGTLAPILALVPHFIKEQKGHIASCSSVSGFLGLMGYTAYTPTKFAVAGLMESLRHELRQHNISFSVLYPPDTETPGFDTENKTKPKELAIMSEGGGLLSAEEVAKCFVRGILKKKFYITPGQSGLLWRIVRHFPRLTHKITDYELQKARKKISKKIN